MPLTGATFFFFIGSLSVIGFPPTGAILSKWYMILGTQQAGMSWVLVVYLVSSFLNAAYFLPIVYKAFFCPDSESNFGDKRQEPPIWALVPPIVTAVGSVVLFFKANFFLALTDLVMGVL